jgi:CysZ protein
LIFCGIFFLSDHLFGWVDRSIAIPWAWLDTAINWSAAVLSFVLLAFVFVLIQKHIVLVLLAPFLGRLAEMTVRGIEGERFVPKLTFFQSIARSARINLGYVVREVGLTLGFFVGGLLIPLIGSFLATVCIFLTESRFAGFGLMDFPLEYKGYDPEASENFVKEHRPEATALGTGYIAMLSLPIIGWMLAPTFATVAGTLATMEKLGTASATDTEVSISN